VSQRSRQNLQLRCPPPNCSVGRSV
jgi:hypothetical protein